MQYRKSGATDWTGHGHQGTATSATLTGLDRDTRYEVQVRATNDEGTGDWSPTTQGSTRANIPPTLPGNDSPIDRAVNENTPAGGPVGSPVTAQDPDIDDEGEINHTLGGADAAHFRIDAGDGQIRAHSPLDHEGRNRYQVTVGVQDGQGGSDSVTVNIAVRDVLEKPESPAAPTVNKGAYANTLAVTWTAPGNTGPPISKYQFRHRAAGETAWQAWLRDLTPGTTGLTIRDLRAGTGYQAQVRAFNDELWSDWSDGGEGRTAANDSPRFRDGESTARSVSESVGNDAETSGRNVGAAVTATDADSGDTITYSLEGADAGSFSISGSTGQIATRTGLVYDHETQDSHQVTVISVDQHATDQGRDTIAVTIRVTNVSEPPAKPRSLTTSDVSRYRLTLGWDPPDITGYDVRYNIQGEAGATTLDVRPPAEETTVPTSLVITGLDDGKTYELRVRGVNADGDGTWSDNAVRQTPANRLPAFTDSAPVTRSLPENSGQGVSVGLPVAATDGDSDTISYSIAGDNEGKFTVNSQTGQLLSGSHDYDHEGVRLLDNPDNLDPPPQEATDHYDITLRADDARGGITDIQVRVNITDRNEPPDAPGRPVVRDLSSTELQVTWTAPGNAGRPPIASYTVQYTADPASTEPEDVAWLDAGHTDDTTKAKITRLEPSTTYRVRIRTHNHEGQSDWSPEGSETTRANVPPVFADGRSTTRAFDENSAAGTPVGKPVAATDTEGTDLTYSLEGTDAGSFAINDGTGQILAKSGVTYDHEARSGYSVTVKALDGHGGTRTISVTIRVSDVDEPPLNPAAPTFTATQRFQTTVGWTVPDNSGRPDISGYNLYHGTGTDTSAYTKTGLGNVTSSTVTGLEHSTAYGFQVSAVNAEGEGPRSTVATETTAANRAPAFNDGTTTSRDLPENSAEDADAGAPVAASDRDGDDLTYSITGSNPGKLKVEDDTGQILAGDHGYDHEGTSSYTITLSVTDGQRGVTPDTISVTVNITDLDEPPVAPGAPTVTGSSSTTVTVSWTAPDNAGKPDISDYDVQYAPNTADATWLDATHTGTDRTNTVTGLVPSTAYKARVRARNAEGESDWSGNGAGRTQANNPPAFTGDTATRSVNENPDVGDAIGSPIAATDIESATLRYSLQGTDAASFDVDAGTGQLRAKSGVDYNHEVKTSYSLTLRVDDEHGGSDTIAVTVNIGDVAEAPEAPATPTATQQTLTTLSFSWTPPVNMGPGITAYHHQHRVGTTASWPMTHTTATSATRAATLTGLSQNQAHQFRVRAVNPEGTGEWSNPASSTTNDNNPPSFDDGTSVTRQVREDVTTVTDMGDELEVTDSDLDDGGTLAYSIEESNIPFTVTGGTGQLRTKAGGLYDHETKNSHSFTVRVEDGQGGSDTITVTVRITDVNEPPGKPDAPTSTAVTITSVSIEWEEPGNDGPPITDYNVSYQKDGDTGWTNHPHTGTGKTATIGSLDRGQQYNFRVQATNPEGTGAWSDAGEFTTTANSDPGWGSISTGVTQSIPENTPPGTTVGSPVTASDVDGDTPTYSLDDTDHFVIHRTTGQVSTATGSSFNFEEQPNSYELTVTAADGHGGTDDLSFTVNITDATEPPGKPDAPTLTSRTSLTLQVSWTAPDNTGPEITGYNVRYRTNQEGSGWAVWPHTGTGTSATIERLIPGEGYLVQVQATNAEGTGLWSDSLTVATGDNNPPVFQEDASASRSMDENTPGGTDIGDPVTATDTETTGLTYTLGGKDSGLFEIDRNTGQLSTAAGADYNYESGKTSCRVTVRAADEHAGQTDITVTIAIQDVEEPPGKPAAPDITAATLNSLTVQWREPENTGPPVTDYDVQYREGTTGSHTDAGFEGTGLTTVLTGLDQSQDHQVEVRATSDEGTGEWSDAATGRTSDNMAPDFGLENDRASFTINENSPAGTEVGTLTASDPDGGAMTYTIGPEADAASFQVSASTGAITTSTAADFNHEVRATYTFSVRAEDGQGGSATATVEVSVADLQEPPGIPELSVSETTISTAALEWTEPENAGPPVTGYTLQFRQGRSGNYQPAGNEPGDLSHTITGLQHDTLHQARVQASSDEGAGAWSQPVEFTTSANQAPAFDQGASASASIPELETPDVTVLTVTARDPEGQAITYSLSENAPFGIDPGSGRVTTVDYGYDYETEPKVRFHITARDTLGGTANLAVTVSVENINEPPTGLPVITGTTGAGAGATLGSDISAVRDPDGNPRLEDVRYQWLQDGSPIQGAQGPTLLLGEEQVGRSITLRVTYTDGGGFTETLTSEPADDTRPTAVTVTPAPSPPPPPAPPTPPGRTNHPPVWRGDTEVSIEENRTMVQQELLAADPDPEDSITGIWISGGPDAALLKLEPLVETGNLRLLFIQPPDHEKPRGRRREQHLRGHAGGGLGHRRPLADRGGRRHHPGAGRPGAARHAHGAPGPGRHGGRRHPLLGSARGERGAAGHRPHPPAPAAGQRGGVDGQEAARAGPALGPAGGTGSPNGLHRAGAGPQRGGGERLVPAPGLQDQLPAHGPVADATPDRHAGPDATPDRHAGSDATPDRHAGPQLGRELGLDPTAHADARSDTGANTHADLDARSDAGTHPGADGAPDSDARADTGARDRGADPDSDAGSGAGPHAVSDSNPHQGALGPGHADSHQGGHAGHSADAGGRAHGRRRGRGRNAGPAPGEPREPQIPGTGAAAPAAPGAPGLPLAPTPGKARDHRDRVSPRGGPGPMNPGAAPGDEINRHGERSTWMRPPSPRNPSPRE